MDMSQAATFLGASILISIGIVILAILLLILNNLFNMFWKPVKMMKFYDPYQQIKQHEPLMDKVEPVLSVTPPKPTMKRK